MATNRTPVFTFGAIVFVAGGMLFGIKMYAEWDGVSVPGTIASIQELSETDSAGTVTNYYEATTTFLTEHGEPASAVLTYYENRYQVGDQLEITYQRSDESRIHRTQSVWWYFLFGGVGGIGLCVMYASTKMKSERWD